MALRKGAKSSADKDAYAPLQTNGGTMIIIGMVMEGKSEQESIARDVRKFLEEKGYTSQVEVEVIKDVTDIRGKRDRLVQEQAEFARR